MAKADSAVKQDWIIKAASGVLLVAQLIVSVAVMVSLIGTNILPIWLIVAFGVLLAGILALNVMKLLVQKNDSLTAKIICAVLAVVCIAGGIFAMRYTDAFNGFLGKISGQSTETKEYNVIVMNESSIKDLQGLNDKSVGFLKTDQYAVRAEQFLQKVVTIEAGYYDDLDTLTGVLSNNLTDAIVLETDRMEMLKEENELNDTRVVYTFKVEIEGEIKASAKKVTAEPFILYISGSDSRTGIKTTARSDVNIVTVVNPEQGKILLVSIPRDTYVQLHDTTGIKDKLTHAGVYGINMSKATIEDFLGITIDHTLKVSFDTVVKVVDELDGIDIDSDKTMTLGSEDGTKCNYVVGVQHVNGACALRFARERKSYETGDRHRGENQQQVITRIIERLSGSKNYLLKVPTILDIAADSFETTLSRDDIASFIRMQLDESIDWQVESIAVDGAGTMEPTYSMGANRPLYVMIPSDDSVANAQQKIHEYLSEK